MKKILLIIPSYNEEKNIIKIKKEIDDYNKVNKVKYDYIFINDCSTDSSNEIFKKNFVTNV